MSQGPRGIPIFIFAPSRNVFRITSVHKNVPGSLLELLTEISKSKLNILSVTTSAIPDAESATLTLVVEASPDVTLRDVKSKLRPSALVPSIEVEPAHSGLVVEDGHFPIIMSGGERLLLMRADLFVPMTASLKKTFGTGGDVILYQMGYSYGETAMQKFIALMGRDYVQENFRELGKVYTALGWCKPTLTKLSPEQGEVEVEMEDSFECSGQRSMVRGSQFLRGHMTAVMDVAWRKEFSSEETECISRGDGRCKFEFRAK
ncbi:MAG: hypothetical protein JRM80_08215 [Nitrososphaerota archaeon]|nr:hypothetical protein [Nitrososphaerota archaeon]